MFPGIYFHIYLFCFCMMWVWVHTCPGINVEVRRQLEGICSLLLSCEPWEWNSGHQPWPEVPLPDGPSCWPLLVYFQCPVCVIKTFKSRFGLDGECSWLLCSIVIISTCSERDHLFITEILLTPLILLISLVNFLCNFSIGNLEWSQVGHHFREKM